MVSFDRAMKYNDLIQSTTWEKRPGYTSPLRESELSLGLTMLCVEACLSITGWIFHKLRYIIATLRVTTLVGVDCS